MKKFLLLLLLCAIAMPVWAEEEQEITPETVIYIQDGDVIRVMTVGEFQDECDICNQQVIEEYHAYEDNDGNMIIPMHPDDIAALKAQESMDAYDEYEEYKSREATTYSYSYSKEWGLKKWFAAYIDAALTVAGGDPESGSTLNAHFYAGGTVLTFDVRVVTITANAEGSTVNASFKIIGKDAKTFEKNFSHTFESDEYTLCQYTTIFPTPIGIPIQLTAKVTGKVGLTLGLTLSDEGLGISGHIVPSAELKGSLVAEATIGIASAGIEGSITFIDIKMPWIASVFYSPETHGLRMKLYCKLYLEAIKGQIDLIIKINLVFFKKTWRMILFKWPGFPYEGVLIDKKTN